MTYENAKIQREYLYSHLARTSAALNAFPKLENGLTPDAVKFSPEFRKAKAEYDFIHKSLKAFNSRFLKTYKKEYAAERKARRPA